MINQEIAKIFPTYIQSLNQYQKLLRNRNILLKRKNFDENYIEILEEKMVEEESKLIEKRREFIDEINKEITNYYQKLSSEDKKIEVIYECCIGEEKEREEALKKLFLETKQKDKEYMMTTEGIHREDILFKMNDQPLVEIASQGQKRMVMLAYKMALMDYIYNKSQERPVLLLDDVFSELDEDHQKRLLELVDENHQCLITTTKEIDIDRNVKKFEVKDGTVMEV